MVAFFQLSCVLGRELRSIAVEHDQDRQPEACGIAVTLDHIGIVSLIDIDQNQEIVFRNDSGEFGIGFEQTAQFVAPASPICPKLENEPFVFPFCGLKGIGDLLIAVGRSVVKPGFGAGTRFSSQQQEPPGTEQH